MSRAGRASLYGYDISRWLTPSLIYSQYTEVVFLSEEMSWFLLGDYEGQGEVYIGCCSILYSVDTKNCNSLIRNFKREDE